MIVRRRHALLTQKQPEVLHLGLEAAHKLPLVVLSPSIESYQAQKPGIKHIALAHGRRGCGHFAQAQQLVARPLATARHARVLALGEPICLSYQVRQATLPHSCPFYINTVPVADQNTLPVFDQGLEGLARTIAVNHEEPHRGASHDPQLRQQAIASPGGLVNIVYLRASGLVGDGVVVWLYGSRNSIENFLDCPKADMQPQNRVAVVLDNAPAVSVGSGQFSDHGREPGAEAGSVFLGYEGFVRSSTLRALAPEKDEVGHIHLNLEQLNSLMRVVGLEPLNMRTAAAAMCRVKLQRSRRGEQHRLPVPNMPHFRPRPPFGLSLGFDGNQRRICGRRLVRVRRIPAGLGFKFVVALTRFVKFLNQIGKQPPYGLRGLCQVLGRDLDVGRKIRWKFEHAPLSAKFRNNLGPVIAYEVFIIGDVGVERLF